MPNIITHTLFAEDMLKLLDEEMLNDRKQLFEIGSSGPDYLFFHNVSPKAFWKKTPLRHIGSQLHESHINDFYRSAVHSIWKEKNPEIRQDMIAYTCGHLCHWALDSSAHPYIFYRTGNCKGQSANDHHRFESILDSLLLKHKKNETIATYDITKEVTDADDEMKRAVARIYVPAVNSIFKENIKGHHIAEALDDWNGMQKVFRDPYGNKIRFARALEKPFGLDNQFSGFAVPEKPEDNYDIMNLLHNEWKNPQTGEPSHDSFFELYDKAINRAAKAIVLFLNACAHPYDAADEKEFLDFLDNRNYEMGTSHYETPEIFNRTDLSI